MEAHVMTATALTSVYVHMDTLVLTARIWFVGVSLHLVKMADPVGTRIRPLVASVKRAGVDYIVTSQVCPVKLLPNKEEWTSHSCASTLASVSMLEMFIIAIVRWGILEVTVRNK